ncbi:MAG: RpiB/LacA/LacB family sugar-phosphate isomerase [bacterium]
MKIIIGCDHVGTVMQEQIINHLKENDIEVIVSSFENHPVDDYTDFAFDVCEKVIQEKALGILICGNGIGMSIAANKVRGIRAARVLTKDDAFKCKNHNGSNVIALSSEVDIELTKEMVDTFICTKTASEERYLRRINKMIDFESKNNEL